MKATTTTEGVTRDGAAVKVVHVGPPRDDAVYINGVQAKVLGVRVYRDGGTRVYMTDGGRLTLPRRRGDDDRTPRWEPRKEAGG